MTEGSDTPLSGRAPSASSLAGATGRPVVEAVLRAFTLLDCFEHGKPELALAELVRRSGLSKTTTYRLLTTLEYAGWLERASGGVFRLTIKAFQVGTILVDSLEFRKEAGPIMVELAARFDDTIYLLVPSGAAAVCLERVESGQAVRIMELDVGGSQAYHLGAGPRALLAFREAELLPLLLAEGLKPSTSDSIVDIDALRADLQGTRERGYSLSRGDRTSGIGAVGAPVFDRTGVAIAALSIGGLLYRFEGERLEELASGLLEACSRLSLRLGYRAAVPAQPR